MASMLWLVSVIHLFWNDEFHENHD
jgi:hypothetical protein